MLLRETDKSRGPTQGRSAERGETKPQIQVSQPPGFSEMEQNPTTNPLLSHPLMTEVIHANFENYTEGTATLLMVGGGEKEKLYT